MHKKSKNHQQPQRSIIKGENLNASQNKLIDNNTQPRLLTQQYYKGICFREQLRPHCEKKFNWLQKKVLKELSRYCKGFWGIFKCRRHHIKRAKLVMGTIEEMKPQSLEEFIYNINLIGEIILSEADLLDESILLNNEDYLDIEEQYIRNSYFQKKHPKAKGDYGEAIPLSAYMHNKKNHELKSSSYMKTLRNAIEFYIRASRNLSFKGDFTATKVKFFLKRLHS